MRTAAVNQFTSPFFPFDRTLSLKENKLLQFHPLDTLSAIQYTIEKFDISGEQNVVTDLQNLRKYFNRF